MQYKNLLLFALFFTITACNSNNNQAGEAILIDNNPDYSDLKAYDSKGKYNAVLKNCVSIKYTASSCSLNKLPLLGMDNMNPGIAEIKSRMVISHNWMGKNFIDALNLLPQDVLNLFRAVTAVVIDSDIRPSYYSFASGAIYIDPAYLWLSNEQKNQVDKTLDYRYEYIKKLSFRGLSRYVKDNKKAYDYYSLADNSERTIQDITMPLLDLLYHELAHANDFAPLAQYANMERTNTIYNVLYNLSSERISSKMNALYPLTSNELKKLADVSFKGNEPTTGQKKVTADIAGSLAHNDGANSFYSYNTQYEDLAMLFEEVMMKKNFGFDKDFVFTSNPPETDADCKEYIVGWGMRNRIANPNVRQRARFVAENIYPDENWDEFFSTLNTETLLATGKAYCDILDDSTIKNKSRTSRPMPIEVFLPPH